MCPRSHSTRKSQIQTDLNHSSPSALSQLAKMRRAQEQEHIGALSPGGGQSLKRRHSREAPCLCRGQPRSLRRFPSQRCLLPSCLSQAAPLHPTPAALTLGLGLGPLVFPSYSQGSRRPEI